ncbi:MAG: hypothetical protein UHY58_01805 [Alistipes sp.]|nr:hypothetical protein [Alistipes sp.]
MRREECKRAKGERCGEEVRREEKSVKEWMRRGVDVGSVLCDEFVE